LKGGVSGVSGAAGEGIDTAPAYSAVTVSRQWAKVFWRLQGLAPGRHLVTVTIGGEAEPVDLVVLAAGKVETPR
jgi:hypothetical protein